MYMKILQAHFQFFIILTKRLCAPPTPVDGLRMQSPMGDPHMNEKEERAAWMVAPLPDLVRHLVGNCHTECRVDMGILESMLHETK